jgi:hypothetical protein
VVALACRFSSMTQGAPDVTDASVYTDSIQPISRTAGWASKRPDPTWEVLSENWPCFSESGDSLNAGTAARFDG